MDFLELAKERYSVRKFSDKKVEREKLDAILEAGRCAPTAVNYQPQRVLVLESPEALEKLKGCTPYHFHAPLALLVCTTARRAGSARSTTATWARWTRPSSRRR